MSPPPETSAAALKGGAYDYLVKQTDYLERLQRKPRTIRLRPQFVEAVADTAERILQKEPKDAQRKVAAVTMFELLHAAAVLDNPDADVKLMHWAEKLAKDPVPEISDAAGLHVLEKRVMDARRKGLETEDAEKLLQGVISNDMGLLDAQAALHAGLLPALQYARSAPWMPTGRG